MMKRMAILLTVTLLTLGWAQAQVEDSPEGTWRFMEVSGPNYHGYAFPNDWEVDLTVEGQDGRFTPEDADIAKAEKLMQKKIAYLNRYHENQEGKVPIIDEHLSNYERQYVGFTDIHGYRIIYINALWDASLKGKLGRDIVRTSGGGPYYWSVKVNLDTEKVYGLMVNDQNSTVTYLPREKKPGPRISKPKDESNPQRIRKTGIIHSNEEKTF
ncbi:MAG: hypothetical protein HUK17_00480 [Bacteroidales bacterium]|nr:hypothetical protein [Bacteroidales bacterium]